MTPKNTSATSKETGAAATALLVLAFVVSLAFVFIAVLPLLKGTDQAARTQTAADAAALAGAEDARDKILNNLWTISSTGSLASLLNTQDGRIPASEYAQRNGAALQTYQLATATGKVNVQVRHFQKTHASGGHIKTAAEATLGVPLAHCKFGEEELPPEPVPPPEPDPDTEGDDDEEQPEPEPEFSYSFTCPGMAAYTDYDDFNELVQDVRHALEPRLKPALSQ